MSEREKPDAFISSKKDLLLKINSMVEHVTLKKQLSSNNEKSSRII